MHRARFRRLVGTALDSIPPEFADRMENVEILVRTRPTPDELVGADLDPRSHLLGLYMGQPLTSPRDSYLGGAPGGLPDRIMIYQEAIESICRNEAEVIEQVRRTVLHEVAHHFGIDDDRLQELNMH